MARQNAVDKAGTTGTTSDRLTQIGEANIFGKVSFDEEGNKTTLHYKSIEFDIEIEESFFTKQNMKRLR